MFRFHANQKGLRLSFEHALDTPPYIRADPDKLRQILINLINHAVKFTPTGTVTIRVYK